MPAHRKRMLQAAALLTHACKLLRVARHHHEGPDAVLGHQAVLHVRVCRHKGLDLVFANVPVGAGQRKKQGVVGADTRTNSLGGTSTIPTSSQVPAHAPEHKQGSIHRLRQCTRHHQLLLLRLQAGVVARVWMQHARLSAQSAPYSHHFAQPTSPSHTPHHLVRARQVGLPERPPLLQDVGHVAVLQHVVAVSRCRRLLG